MRKLTLLSAVFLLGILLAQTGFANGTYKYSSKPHLRVQSAQTTIDAIYVSANVAVSDVRVSMHAKVVMYSSLRITLRSPRGVSVLLKEESGNAAASPLYGSLGTSRSHILFQDGGNSWGQQPNDMPIAPKSSLAFLNGVLAQGWWQLEIKDERSAAINAIPQDGYLEAWTLFFNEQIVEPVQPFNPAVTAQWTGGGNLYGRINGVAARFGDPANLAQIPNDGSAVSPGSQCNYPNDPSVLVGLNGDCFPILVSGHPGALVGQNANGYPAGRFRITITVEPTYPAAPIVGLTEDIAIYFGRVPDAALNLPLADPPGLGDPGYKAEQYIGGWPSGGASVASSLEGPSSAFGGVRLAACISPSIADLTGYDRVVFDDLATVQIDNGVGVPPGPTLAPIFTGPFKPMQPISSLDGKPVDGLYYVTVYDAFNENESGSFFGHIRVTYLHVEYIVGGGEVPNPERHQGFVGPLAGIPVPGPVAGTPFGYLSDAIGIIPPYKEHAQVQDPILMMWSTQKMYPRDAVGTERIMAVDQNNNSPVIHYHGPYAYPGILDDDPTKAGAFINADLFLLPEGEFNFRVNLMQARYDDDFTDNEYESPEISVNPVTVSYFGDQVISWNMFVDPEHVNVVASVNVAPGQGYGTSFSFFEPNNVKISSVDFKFDEGGIITPRGDCRISIWNTTNKLTGTPNALVARSTTVNENSYIEGNWRTFPIYPVDGNGNPDINAGGSVALPAGTYIVTIDAIGNNSIMVYPYTFGAIPSMTDRYYDYLFGDNYGPVGPTNPTGTYMTYISVDNTAAPWASFGISTAENFSNHVFPVRVNMTTKNDFSVNYVRFSSQTSPTEAISINQQVTPSVNCTANSDQGGLKKDFNIYIGIYDAGNNLLYSDMVNVANAPYNGISGFETITVNMASWTPTQGGIYHVKAYFTRNPDDQNPVNDMIEYDLYVQATPVIAYDNDVDQSSLNELVDVVSARGEDPVLVNMSQSNLKAFSNSTIYVLGNMNATTQSELTAAIAKGNDVAFVYNTNENLGSTVQSVDKLYGIERAGQTDYANLNVAPTVTTHPGATAVSFDPTLVPQISSKEDLLAFLNTQDAKVEPMRASLQKDVPLNSTFNNALPIATRSQFGEILFLSETQGSLGIIYTIPSNRKAGHVVVDGATPTAFALGQNYPNPFNPSTMISYTLAENSMVTLRVIDVLGREIATLVSQAQEAGDYAISWKGVDMNGVDVPTGTYLYRIDAVPSNGGATFSSTKKMVLSK
jgi:subtilisin-like proprotein convertase family protein